MADLGSALVDLAKVSEGRAVARKRLRQAVATVARQIDNLMEAAESITVDDVTYRSTDVTWWVAQFTDRSDAILHPNGGWVLCRDGRALYSPRDSWFDGQNLRDVCHGDLAGLVERDVDATPVEYADADELIAFCAEAGRLVAALAVRQARERDAANAAAEAVSRVVVR